MHRVLGRAPVPATLQALTPAFVRRTRRPSRRPIRLSTASGVRGVSQERINAARSLGATRAQVVRHVIVPSALPSILTGLRIALGAGWSTLVAAELVAATRGLGFMIQSAAQFLVTDVVIMGILVIAAIAFVLEFIIRRLERVLVPWAGRE